MQHIKKFASVDLKTVIRHPVISGASLIFFGTLFANVFNFLFNVYMFQTLTPADNGILATIVSLILLFTLIADSLMPTVVHFAASYFAKNEIDKIRDLFWKLLKIFFIIGTIFILAFLVTSSAVAGFFKIDSKWLVILAACIVFVNMMANLNRAIIQARLLFGYISFVNAATSIAKLAGGVLLVFLGLRVYGALYGFLLGSLIGYLVTFFPLAFLFKDRRVKSDVTLRQLVSYAGPSSVSLLSVTLLITADLLLVKHFYSPEEAGIYAGLSLLGKIIFFLTAPIAMVMFPLVVQRRTRQEKYLHLFMVALALVSLLSLSVVFFYFLFPEFSIRVLLKQDEYLAVKPILGLFGIHMSLFSLLFLATNFYLSVKKVKVFIPLMIGAIAQFFLLWFIHDSFFHITIVSLSVVSLLLISLLLYYVKHYHYGAQAS